MSGGNSSDYAGSEEPAVLGHPLATLAPQALLFLLIGGMAGSCDANQLIKKFTSSEARGIGAGLVCQYVILPLMGFISLSIFPQDPVVALTLLMVTTSPGGGFSGFWCSVVNADLALSVAMTTASTIAVTAALPFNIYFYLETMFPDMHVAIAWDELVLSVIIVVCAVIFGATVSWAANKWQPEHVFGLRQGMNTLGSAAGVCLMVFGGATNASSDTPLWENSNDWFACIALPCVLGLVAALGVARTINLSNPSAVAVAIECCYQNTGLALTIALSAVPPEAVGRASGVPIFYGLVEIALIPIFAIIAWKMGWTYAPADENACIALAKNYQPVDDENAPLVEATAESGMLTPKQQTSGEDEEGSSLAAAMGGTPGVAEVARKAFPNDEKQMERRSIERSRPKREATFKLKGPPGETTMREPSSPKKLLTKYTQLQFDMTEEAFATALVTGEYTHKDKQLNVRRLLDDYVSKWKEADPSLKNTSPELLKRDMLSQDGEMVSARGTPNVKHPVSHLLLACYEDQAKRFVTNARLAERARAAQYQLIKGMVLAGASLPYRITDAMDNRGGHEYRRGVYSFLRDLHLMEYDTRHKMLNEASPRLVRAFASFSEDELWQVLGERFFEDPALLLYQVSMLCYSAMKEAGRAVNNKREADHLTAFSESLQEKTVTLLAFIDCPLDSNNDSYLDDKPSAMSDPRHLIDVVLCNARGWLALRVAAECDCKTLLGHESLAPFFSRHRRGSLYHQLQEEFQDYNGVDFSFHTRLYRRVFVLVVILVNLSMLPFIPVLLALRQLYNGILDSIRWCLCFPSNGGYARMGKEKQATLDTEAQGPSLWVRSEAKPQYSTSTVVRGFWDHGFELGGGIRDRRYVNAQQVAASNAEGGSTELCADSCQIGADRFRFAWLNALPPALYILEEPWIEGWLREVAELAQLLFLSSLRLWKDEALQARMVTINYLWCIAVLCTELQELLRTGKLYLNNGLNYVQISGLTLVLMSLTYEFFAEGLDQDTSRTIMAIGILLLWMHTLRTLFRFQGMGSLVYILFEMFKDVAKWVVLQFLVVLAFGVAMFSLYYDTDTWDDDCNFGMIHDPASGFSREAWLPNVDGTRDGDPAGFFDQVLRMIPGIQLIGHMHDRTDGMFYLLPLFTSGLIGDNKLDCLRKTRHALAGPFLMLAFLISTVVVLTNLLIAMMNTRFAMEYQKGEALFRTSRARETLFAKGQNSMRPPTPFNLLFVIQGLVMFFKDTVMTFCACGTEQEENEMKPDPLAPTEHVLKQLDAAAVWWESNQNREKTKATMEELLGKMRVKVLNKVEEFESTRSEDKRLEEDFNEVRKTLEESLKDVLEDKKILKDPLRRQASLAKFDADTGSVEA